jgi:hypothetical protein
MASTQIMATGKIVEGEIHWKIAPLDGELQAMIDAGQLQEPPTRDERAEESAALYDNARYYEWLKAEREDYADYLADVEWMRLGC